MKKNISQSLNSEFIKNYQVIMKNKSQKLTHSPNNKNINWQNGEYFEIFSLFKNIPSGVTSTDSSLTSFK